MYDESATLSVTVEGSGVGQLCQAASHRTAGAAPGKGGTQRGTSKPAVGAALPSLQRPDRTGSPRQGVAREGTAEPPPSGAKLAGVSPGDPPRERRLAARRARKLSDPQRFPLGAPRGEVDDRAEPHR